MEETEPFISNTIIKLFIQENFAAAYNTSKYLRSNILPVSVGERYQQQRENIERIYAVTDGLKSSRTKQAYRLAFNYFLKIAIKNTDLRALIDTKPSVIEQKIIAHIEFLRDVRKLAYVTIQVHLAAIFHFFEMNDIQINTRKIKRFLPSDDNGNSCNDRPYTPEEIQRILSFCDERSRVIFLLLASTGMRIGAIPGLRIGDLNKISQFSLYMIWVYNTSKSNRYYTFCSPECAVAIDDYLAYRKRVGEPCTENAPLIRNKITIENPFTIRTPKFLGTRGIQLIIEKVLKESGLYKKNEIMRSYGLRKFFSTQCSRVNMDYVSKEYLMGHRLPGQESSYNRMTEEDRLKEYSKVIDALTLSPVGRLQQQIQTHKQDRDFILSEIRELKRCVNHMSSLMKQGGIDTGGVEAQFDEFCDIATKHGC